MSNLTSTINDLLQAKNADSIERKAYSLDNINEFLKEAYQINSRIYELITYLRSIRQSYLSAAPPPRRRHVLHGTTQQTSAAEQIYLTNEQRDQIDAEAKGVLRDLHAAVFNLKQAEQIRQSADEAILKKRRHRNGFGVLGQWANGGGATAAAPEEQADDARATTIKAFREGVVWYLEWRLQECGGVQTSMMQIRINRELEKNKSVLYKSGGLAAVPAWDDNDDKTQRMSKKAKTGGQNGLGVDEYNEFNDGQALNDDQVQIFAQENKDMLKLYEDKLGKVRAVERSLIEISEMQSTIVQNLNLQSEQLDQLVQDSHSTEENVGSGNKELKRASERRSTAKLVFYSTLGLCSAAILWDFYI